MVTGRNSLRAAEHVSSVNGTEMNMAGLRALMFFAILGMSVFRGQARWGEHAHTYDVVHGITKVESRRHNIMKLIGDMHRIGPPVLTSAPGDMRGEQRAKRSHSV